MCSPSAPMAMSNTWFSTQDTGHKQCRLIANGTFPLTNAAIEHTWHKIPIIIHADYFWYNSSGPMTKSPIFIVNLLRCPCRLHSASAANRECEHLLARARTNANAAPTTLSLSPLLHSKFAGIRRISLRFRVNPCERGWSRHTHTHTGTRNSQRESLFYVASFL